MSRKQQVPAAGILVGILCLIVLGVGIAKIAKIAKIADRADRADRAGEPAEPLVYKTNFSQASAESRDSGKPMMINFGGDW